MNDDYVKKRKKEIKTNKISYSNNKVARSLKTFTGRNSLIQYNSIPIQSPAGSHSTSFPPDSFDCIAYKRVYHMRTQLSSITRIKLYR